MGWPGGQTACSNPPTTVYERHVAMIPRCSFKFVHYRMSHWLECVTSNGQKAIRNPKFLTFDFWKDGSGIGHHEVAISRYCFMGPSQDVFLCEGKRSWWKPRGSCIASCLHERALAGMARLTAQMEAAMKLPCMPSLQQPPFRDAESTCRKLMGSWPAGVPHEHALLCQPPPHAPVPGEPSNSLPSDSLPLGSLPIHVQYREDRHSQNRLPCTMW